MSIAPENMADLFYVMHATRLMNKEFLENEFLWSDLSTQYFKRCDELFYYEGLLFFACNGISPVHSLAAPQPPGHCFNEIVFENCVAELFNPKSVETASVLEKLGREIENPQFEDKISAALAAFHILQSHSLSDYSLIIPYMDRFLKAKEGAYWDKFISFLLQSIERQWHSYPYALQQTLDAWLTTFLAVNPIVVELADQGFNFAVSFLQLYHQRHENWNESLKYAGQIVSFDEGTAFLNVGKAMILSGEYELAREAITSALAVKRDPESVYLMGLLKEKEPDQEGAVTLYKEALENGYEDAINALKMLPNLSKSVQKLIRQKEGEYPAVREWKEEGKKA